MKRCECLSMIVYKGCCKKKWFFYFNFYDIWVSSDQIIKIQGDSGTYYHHEYKYRQRSNSLNLSHLPATVATSFGPQVAIKLVIISLLSGLSALRRHGLWLADDFKGKPTFPNYINEVRGLIILVWALSAFIAFVSNVCFRVGNDEFGLSSYKCTYTTDYKKL